MSDAVAPSRTADQVGFGEIPDLNEIAHVTLSGENSCPNWIRQQHPEYVQTHTGHPLTSTREFEHQGRKVKVTTTYKIEIDGEEVLLHAAVGMDGKVHCHALPYDSFSSVTDLVKSLMDALPHSFEQAHGGQAHPHPNGHHH
ncbi:MAG: hypothetical protein ACKPEY_05265 [Planctomycetota bacterium]